MIRSVPILHESRNLQLRRTVPNDAGILFRQGFSQREFMRLFCLNDAPANEAVMHQRLVRRQQISPDQETYLELLIVHRRYGPIGLCGLADYCSLNRRAEYLVGLFETSRRQAGYGLEVTLMMLDLAFNTYDMNKVYASTYGYNQPAQQGLKSVGFQLEGYSREHVFDQVTQQFVDLHNYCMTVKDFRAYKRLTPLSLRLLGHDITLASRPPTIQARDDTRAVLSGSRVFQSASFSAPPSLATPGLRN